MLITFSGLDGSGKTTLIRRLRSALKRDGKTVEVLTMYDHVGVYALIRLIRDRMMAGIGADFYTASTDTERVGGGAIRPPSILEVLLGVARSRFVKRCMLVIDLAVLMAFRLWVEFLNGRVLILDRYFYDSLTDVIDGQRWRFARLFLKLIPVPDMPVFVDVAPEVAFERKREYPVEYMRRRRAVYHRLFSKVKGRVILENDDLTACAERLIAASRQRLGGTAFAREGPELLTIRLLLDGTAGLPEDWDSFLSVAKSNVVLVRCRDAFARHKIPMPEDFIAAAMIEQERIREAATLIAQLTALCATAGIQCVFTKAFQHFPDMGHDIDLFVADRSSTIDALLKDRLGARPLPGSFANRISGKTGYEIPGRASPIEIHHGRLGHLGEHRRFAEQILTRRRKISIAGIDVFVPSPEDQLLLQALQRIYGHFSIRVTDVCASLRHLRRSDLDWKYILEMAAELRIMDGFRFYLACIDDIYASATGQSLALPLLSRNRVPLPFDDVFRIPRLLAAEFYVRQMASAGAAGDGEMLARLTLLPICACIAACRRLRGLVSPQESDKSARNLSIKQVGYLCDSKSELLPNESSDF